MLYYFKKITYPIIFNFINTGYIIPKIDKKENRILFIKDSIHELPEFQRGKERCCGVKHPYWLFSFTKDKCPNKRFL